VDLLRDALPPASALDAALTHALLEEVAGGGRPATLRVYRPRPTVAFGRLDALRPGFRDAVCAAAAHGFTPVLRQPGGHAAAYDGASLVVDQVRPEREIVPALQRRFADAAGLFAGALRGLGVDARVGEVPGAYCPGGYSVNARGRVKLVGLAQRLVRGASLLGAVVVVGGAERIRDVLSDVYAALDLAWDPATAGAVEDEVAGVDAAAVEAAVLAAYASGEPLAPAALGTATLARARALEPAHRLTPPVARPG
jgi:octanoyl-[GcvH]:protein N-octanoyltransferase